MPSLQIRQLPEEVYEALASRAERSGRSLAQQAIAELRRVPELEARAHRLQVVAQLRERLAKEGPRRIDPNPEELVRQDRDR